MKFKMTNETKTGLVVLIAGLLFGFMILKVGNFKLFQKGFTIQTRLHFTEGVKKHAPVRLSGVDVGEVRDVRVIYGDDTLVELDLWLQNGVKVRQDSYAVVTTLGLMGEKYVEIRAGTAGSPYAGPGGVIRGEDPVRLEDLVKVGTKVADDISRMAKDISHMTKRIDVTIADNKPKIDMIFDNLEETSENVRDFSQDIKYHPWKILFKGKEVPKEQIAKDRVEKLAQKSKTNFTPK